MTAELKHVLAYLIKNYPSEKAGDLSNARVTKMVYLADWHFALNHQRQMTNISWFFDTYGPFVKDIEKTAGKHSDIFVTDFGNNRFGMPKKTFSLRDPSKKIDLGKAEKKSLDHIIKVTGDLTWRNFINLIYSSYPVQVSEHYTVLDLPPLAEKYKALQKQQA